jgi:hypothetical protein
MGGHGVRELRNAAPGIRELEVVMESNGKLKQFKVLIVDAIQGCLRLSFISTH